MTDLLDLMLPPFAACLVLVGIHSYLGLHVIGRQVIFVDLALAQIAAFGATFGYLMGIGPHSSLAYPVSLSFAVLGAAVFAMSRMRQERVPQEAVIGVTYAVALAAAILVADRAPEGAEHIKETLTGSILWVSWEEVLKTAVIYAVIGALHYMFHKPLFRITYDHRGAYADGMRVKAWDFFFYLTFAFVITSSVRIAGVLLVFSFLVIPAVIATLFAEKISHRLAIAWSVGFAGSLAGLVGSYRFDFPSGPSVVCSLGAALILAGLISYVRHSERKGRGIRRILAGSGAAAVFLAGLWVFLGAGGAWFEGGHGHGRGDVLDTGHDQEPGHGRGSGESRVPAAGRPDRAPGSGVVPGDAEADARSVAGLTPAVEPAEAARRLAATDPLEWTEGAVAGLRSGDVELRDWTIEVLSVMERDEARELLVGEFHSADDQLLRLAIAASLFHHQTPEGIDLLLELLEGGRTPYVRMEALEELMGISDSSFGYDPMKTPAENRESLARWQAWAGERR